jgi:hypothetical protein
VVVETAVIVARVMVGRAAAEVTIGATLPLGRADTGTLVAGLVTVDGGLETMTPPTHCVAEGRLRVSHVLCREGKLNTLCHGLPE